jgi:hypothetical protein
MKRKDVSEFSSSSWGSSFDSSSYNKKEAWEMASAYEEEGVKSGEQEFKFNGANKWSQSGEEGMKRWLSKYSFSSKYSYSKEEKMKTTRHFEQHWKGQFEDAAKGLKQGAAEEKRKKAETAGAGGGASAFQAKKAMEEGKKKLIEEQYKLSGARRYKARTEAEVKTQEKKGGEGAEEEFKMYGDGRDGSLGALNASSPSPSVVRDSSGYDHPPPPGGTFTEEGGKTAKKFEEEGVKMAGGGDGGNEEAMKKWDLPHSDGDGWLPPLPAADGGTPLVSPCGSVDLTGDGGGVLSIFSKAPAPCGPNDSPPLNKHFEHPELFDPIAFDMKLGDGAGGGGGCGCGKGGPLFCRKPWGEKPCENPNFEYFESNGGFGAGVGGPLHSISGNSVQHLKSKRERKRRGAGGGGGGDIDLTAAYCV